MSKNIFGFLRSEKFLFSCWIVFCFTITTILFAPGLDDNDTDTMILQSRGSYVDNWHSPFIVTALRWGRSMSPQFGPYDQIFFFTIGAFWLASGIIAYLECKTLFRRCCMASVAGFFPPSLLLLIADNKDSIMCASLLLAYAFLLLSDTTMDARKRPLFAGAAGFMLLCVTAERHNGLVAVIPLTVWLVSIASKIIRPTKLLAFSKVTILGTVLSVTLLSVDLFITERISGAVESYPSQMLLYWDLLAISVKSGTALVPNLDQGAKPFSLSELRSRFVGGSCDPIFWCDSDGRRFYFVNDDDKYNKIKLCWLKAILNHPSLYLEHRLQAFLSVLGLVDREHQIMPHLYLMYDHSENNTTPSPFLHSSFNSALRRLSPAARLPLLPAELTAGAPYLIFLSIFLLGACRKRWAPRLGEPYLVSSAWLYALAFFFISVGSNQRYMTYSISVSGVLLARILFASRYTFLSGHTDNK